MRRCFVMLAVGCYSPSFPVGAPCVTDADCPSTQRCIADRCGGTDTDGGIDQPVADDCWEAWLAGTVEFESPERVEELLAAIDTFDPSLSPDGLTIYVARIGLNNGIDILRAERLATTDRFGELHVIEELVSSVDETRLSTDDTESVAVFASDRVGGAGLTDLWQAIRDPGADRFGMPSVAAFPMINDADPQFDPELTPDGLHLYYAPQVNGVQTIRLATRTTTSDPFGEPRLLAISGLTNAADPAISPDERVLVFAGQLAGEPDDLYYVTRTSSNGGFTSPRLVPGVNSPEVDGDVEISNDGCTLYFATNRADDNPTRDIYSATVKR